MKNKPSSLLPIYLRREPSTDPSLLNLPVAQRAKKVDVVAYNSLDDARNNRAKFRWPWFATETKPIRNSKRVMINCFVWGVVWLDDKTASKMPKSISVDPAAVALIIRNSLPIAPTTEAGHTAFRTMRGLAERLASHFEATNPNFDSIKARTEFLSSCGVWCAGAGD